MKLQNPNENRVVINIKTASRDASTGKVAYKNVRSFDVYEAKPEEVVALVVKGLESATGSKIPAETKTETKPATTGKK